MRWLPVLFLLAAGCLEAPAEPSPSDASDDAETGAEDRSGARVGAELLRRSVNTPGPGPHGFTFSVPTGGATDVTWHLTIEGAGRVTSTVTGSGCASGSNVNIAIGGTATVSGPCADLGPGDAGITVQLTDPALSFTVAINGRVLAD